jgi:hypothetical protein
VFALCSALSACGLSKHTQHRPPPLSNGAAGSSPGQGDAGAGTSSDGNGGEPGASGGLGGTSGDSAAAGAGDTSAHSTLDLEGSPFYTRFQRLTNSQWEHAVTDLLRLDAPPGFAKDFEPPTAGIADFDNNERLLAVDGALADSYETAAEALAERVTSSQAALAAIDPDTDAAGFVQSFGRRVFRRPLTSDEQTRYEGIFAVGEQLYGEGFAHGASLVIRAMLQSPYFLYRTELGPGGQALDGYELASKLSFWLRGTTPSDELLDAAAAGELDSADGLETVARQMLEEPAAGEVMRDFHGQLMHLARYQSLTKTGVPEYSEALNSELEQASSLFFDRVFQQNLGLREILTTHTGYVGPAMAALYGLDAPASGFEERELGAGRAGYFMQLPFLTLYAINRQSDPIERGFALQLDVLCAVTSRLPLVTLIPPAAAGTTQRQHLSELTAGCGGACHAQLNPLGFAFENFDGMGQARDTDNGGAVDTAASYPFEDGTREFADARELMSILADDAQAHRCYSKKVAGYALQRDIVASDRPLLGTLSAVSRAGSLKDMVLALVRDSAFRLRASEEP